jgi:hypothetical protein
MLCRLHIAIDRDSPSLVPPCIPIVVLSFGGRGKFGAEEEDVDAAEEGNLVEVIHNVGFEGGLGFIDDQDPINIHNRTSL